MKPPTIIEELQSLRDSLEEAKRGTFEINTETLGSLQTQVLEIAEKIGVTLDTSYLGFELLQEDQALIQQSLEPYRFLVANYESTRDRKEEKTVDEFLEQLQTKTEGGYNREELRAVLDQRVASNA